MKTTFSFRQFLILVLSFAALSPAFAYQDSIPLKKNEIAPLVKETPSLFTILTHDAGNFHVAYFMRPYRSDESEMDRFWGVKNSLFKGDFKAASGTIHYMFQQEELNHEAQLLLGLSLLSAKNFSAADSAFRKAAMKGSHAEAYVDSILFYTAAYLKKYAGKKAGPIFEHFNGAFFNFLQDSLKWNPDFPSERLNGAIRILMDLQMLLPSMNITWMELTGDLVLNHSYRFYGRWFAATAYYRAGQLNGDKEKGSFWYKAAFAMESNRKNPRYFNDERFDEFEAGIRAEQKWDSLVVVNYQLKDKPDFTVSQFPDSLKKVWQNSDSIGNAWFAFLPADSSRPFLIAMAADFTMVEERQQPFNPNADLENADMKKKVKRNVYFNIYAIFILLVVVGAGVFFFRQVRKIDREYHGTGKK